MPKITINGKEIEFENGMTVLQACEIADVEIPRFCYHERLSIAGNCRMCLVELEKSPKPIASCAMPASEGMIIKTNTEFVEKARKGVMEFLLANHPLDCPVCDQGGECDLQDQSLYYGVDKSRFVENKRSVKEKYMGPLIKTQMTRCIHCTRCVRFATEVAGVPELGAIGRGEDMEITTYLEKSMNSELSGNVIDLCPVGALTSKPYAFEARPWELKKTESIDVMDGVGSNIRVDTFGWEVKRILPRLNEEINEEWISDKSRYSCDGLLNQRLDVPYIKRDNKFEKITWDEALEIVKEKIENIQPEEIAGHVGDLVNLETMVGFKKFFKKIKSSNIEFRDKDFYLNTKNKEDYIFNTSINKIEEADLILLLGCNPRREATMINARIRKSYIKNKPKIFSIGDPGDLTYDYKILGNSTLDIKAILEEKSSVSEMIDNSKKPIFIIGESTLKLKSGAFIFEEIKKFLKKKNFIRDDWNALNILLRNASSVGAADLGFCSDINFFDKLKVGKFKLVYLLGSDNLKFDKKESFVIYQGSHGDNGASKADLILPGAAYTEQDGLYANVEGRVQECKKASYPPGDAKEDYEVLNLIYNKIFNENLYKNHNDLRDETIGSLKNFSKINQLPQINSYQSSNVQNYKFENEKVNLEDFDYYFSNCISRSSKTMSECRNIRETSNNKGTGTNG